MALIRWEPLREVDTLQREMNRLFDNLLTTQSRSGRDLAYAPAAEMQETSEAYNLKLEIPGVDPQDLDIQVTTEAVSVTGERKSETKVEEGGTVRSEFHYGKFQRVISLPGRIDNQNVKADYQNGILHLTLPKAEEEKNKVVKVNLG